MKMRNAPVMVPIEIGRGLGERGIRNEKQKDKMPDLQKRSEMGR
jgi:hypothetical protein